MATKSASLRLILEALNDTGEAAEKSLDVTGDLDGYTDYTPGRRIALAAAAADQAVSFTDAIGIVLVSHDNPFGLRLAAGETLLENLRFFVAWGTETDEGVHQTSILLTGNTVNVADVEVWIIEAED